MDNIEGKSYKAVWTLLTTYIYLSTVGTLRRNICLNINRVTVTENTLIQRSHIKLYKQTNDSYRQSTTHHDELVTGNSDLTFIYLYIYIYIYI